MIFEFHVIRTLPLMQAPADFGDVEGGLKLRMVWMIRVSIAAFVRHYLLIDFVKEHSSDEQGGAEAVQGRGEGRD